MEFSIIFNIFTSFETLVCKPEKVLFENLSSLDLLSSSLSHIPVGCLSFGNNTLFSPVCLNPSLVRAASSL